MRRKAHGQLMSFGTAEFRWGKGGFETAVETPGRQRVGGACRTV